MDDFITTEEVAQLAGVGPTAVKRWADAAVLPCHRTAGGHRRFRRVEVDAFLRARGAAPAGDAEDGATRRWGSGEPRIAGDQPSGAPRGVAQRWADLLLAKEDARVLEGELLAERGRLGTWYRVADAVAAGLAHLGVRWSRGEVSIVDEHIASGRLARALAAIGAGLPLDPRAPRAALACAEGDEHTLGLALAELCLREAGWHTLWLGRRTPVVELVKAIAAREAQVLVVTASSACTDPGDLARQAQLLAASCAASGVALVLGGGGPWPELLEGGFRLHDFEAFHHALSRWGSPSQSRPIAPPR